MPPSVQRRFLDDVTRVIPTSRADETMLIPRRPSPDEADYTLIRPFSTDHPLTEPLAPPEAHEPPADDLPISPPESTNTPSQTPGWNPQELTRIEKQLAHFVGPVAGVLVRNGTRETGDLVSLIRWLAAKLTNAPDRAAFLSSSGVTAVRTGAGALDSDTKAFSIPADGGAALTPGVHRARFKTPRRLPGADRDSPGKARGAARLQPGTVR